MAVTILRWIAGPGGVPVDMAAPGVLAEALGRLGEDHARRTRLGGSARAHAVGDRKSVV